MPSEISANSNIHLDDDPPLLITVREAGRKLGLGKTSVFALLASHKLERRRINGATRVTLRSVLKLAGL